MDIYIYNADLQQIGIIDQYKSLIWTNRYNELGDCELYVPAKPENLELLQIGYYMRRLDDDTMVCRILRTELTTDVENGDYIIVTGQDAKGLFDQRIIDGLVITKLTAITFITRIIGNYCINGSAPKQFQKSNGEPLFAFGTWDIPVDWCDITGSWENVGQKTREICQQFGYGYKVNYNDDTGVLTFYMVKGADRSATVIFSEDYENLATTDYIDDSFNMGNVFRVCGEGEGTARTTITIGNAAGIDRYELYIDARDISRTLTGEDLKTNYPGSVMQDGSGGYYWNVEFLNIPIYTDEQLADLQAHYSGSIIVYPTRRYFQIHNANVATLDKSTLDDSDNIDVNDLIYLPFLYQRGAEKMEEYGRKKTFNGEIEPEVTFYYKQDYFLGDIVTVKNSYGIQAAARITEVLEVDDENGYRMEPKFEYRSVE